MGYKEFRVPARGRGDAYMWAYAWAMMCPVYDSAIKKLSEFWHLDYPDKMWWSACTTMGVCTRDPTWFDIRDNLYVKKDPAMRGCYYRTVQRPVPR